jgi:hypothetical protein
MRQAARQSKTVRLTALLHHITTDLLKRSYLALARDAAPGSDGVTWQAYGVLDRNCQRRTAFNNERWTSMPLLMPPWYSMKPNLRNLFMKKLVRDRVVPIIPASVS